ncbi:membrane protein DedA, SNARE-associated domain [Halogranum rubrum]|uniref:Membrane protein DedA, SNARE-associated domain n=1 Tax=Halogranum rubrum TaxID=553466 RepID=A0A1I4EP52_9EURY|nr:DedA family protein [Halogranum rubrum]SFL06993.1 membrane protein DedA, SNARE-associated domain [Halogranum rubrum]
MVSVVSAIPVVDVVAAVLVLEDLTSTAVRLLRLYGPFVLCLFTFLETSMLFPFLPSEVVVPAAAALLVTDPLSFLVFVTAATVGGTVGAFVPFYVFADTRVGRASWIRARITVSEGRIERGQRWFRERGQSSVCWGRFLPVLRSVISIPAGLANMDPQRFVAYTAIGTAAFYAATGAIVYYGRQQSFFATAVEFVSSRPLVAVVGLAALFGLGYVGRRWADGQRQ